MTPACPFNQPDKWKEFWSRAGSVLEADLGGQTARRMTLTEEQGGGDLRSGRLVRVLSDWCAPFSGYHLYYPNRRQPAQAFAQLVEALRYVGGDHSLVRT